MLDARLWLSPLTVVVDQALPATSTLDRTRREPRKLKTRIIFRLETILVCFTSRGRHGLDLGW